MFYCKAAGLVASIVIMNKSDLAPLIDSLIPGLYGFAHCLIPDDKAAEQLVLDAYSVFLIREREGLRDMQADLKGARERAELKRYLRNELLFDLYELARTRAPQMSGAFKRAARERAFYRLDLAQRAAVWLKEQPSVSFADIEEIVAMKKHQVIELLRNGRALLAAGHSEACL